MEYGENHQILEIAMLSLFFIQVICRFFQQQAHSKKGICSKIFRVCNLLSSLRKIRNFSTIKLVHKTGMLKLTTSSP